MKFEVHKSSAEEYFKIAEEEDSKLNVEKDDVKIIAFRVVAAQNYFYSIVNLIEAAFAKKLAYHSFSHENRMNKLMESRTIFSNEIIKLYELVDRDQRNKVTYRGENGEKYKNIKQLAKKLMELQ